MNIRATLIAVAMLGFAAVLLGAFGAHALKDVLDPEMIQTWNTAVQYHFVHTLALFGTGLLQLQQPHTNSLRIASVAFVAGILLFSGSLYLLALSGISKLGMITPVGGLLFLVGWAALLMAAIRWPANRPPPSPSS